MVFIEAYNNFSTAIANSIVIISSAFGCYAFFKKSSDVENNNFKKSVFIRNSAARFSN